MLRAEGTPERILRSVANMLAASGDYCIADIIDAHGRMRRLEIAHADPSRREKLRIAAEDVRHAENGRVARLLREGSSEMVASVKRGAASERLADIVLLRGELVRSYIAAAISVSGTPMAVLTMVKTQARHAFGAGDLAFLEIVADWTGLGMENALRRELQPRASVAPPPLEQAQASLPR